MSKKFFLLLVLSVSPALFAQDFIILFKQSEIALTAMEHEQYQGVLQSANQKSVVQLKDWLGSREASKANLRDLWLIRGAVATLSGEQAKKLAKEPWVHAVTPNKKRMLVPPSQGVKVGNSLKDLEGGIPWGLERVGLSKIHAEFPNLTGSGVRVGILDTGIQGNHPEIKTKLTHFSDFVNHMENSYDDHGHGTHVAGTIAGNETGLAPGATLMMGKIFSAAGGGDDVTILHAMQWAFDPDGNPATKDYPQVVSNSWGADVSFGVISVDEVLPYSQALQAWINGGIIPVFAAGNSGKSPNGLPGGLPEALSVGAIDAEDKVAEFSSSGPNLWKVGSLILTLLKPDISAPGVKVTSAFPGNKYATWDGTSMATPHVTGAIALALQANPKLKYAEVKELLLKSCDPKVNVQYGFGTLNAHQLVKLAIQTKTDSTSTIKD